MMRIFSTLVIAGAVIAGGAFAFNRFREHSGVQARGSQEAERQQPEIEQCRARLKQLHEAWSRYRAEHDGADPPTVDALLPKYVRSADLLMCPTGERWADQGGAVEQGAIRVNDKSQPVSYGFRWLTAGFPAFAEREGESIPLITCSTHREVVYRAAYGRAPQLGALDERELAGLVPAVRSTKVLAVTKGGEVVEL
jgi:hypothetical protein